MPDAIALVGLSGSGKSTIGRLVAERLHRPYIDLDDLIEETAGASPADLIKTYGEGHFRELESRALAESCAIGGAVIATGGGAVIEPLNRWTLADAGTTIWLDAPDEQLLARLAGHDEERPMLAGDAVAALASLRAARAPYYRAADARIDASLPERAVVDAVVEVTAEREARTARPADRAPRRLFDAVVPRDHPMGPSEARVVLGREMDGSMLDEMLATTSSGAPVVIADRRAAAALPELMAALPGGL